MRHGRLGGGGILSMVFAVIILGFLIAVFRKFDWDVISAVQWGFNQIWDLLSKIADKFTQNSWFQNTFS